MPVYAAYGHPDPRHVRIHALAKKLMTQRRIPWKAAVIIATKQCR